MTSTKIHELLHTLEANYQRIEQLFQHIPEVGWSVPVQHDDARWTVKQMLIHMVDAQRGMTGQIKRVLAGQETVPADFDLSRWNRRTVDKQADKMPTELIQGYGTDRAELTTLVSSLSDADLEKQGRHGSLVMLSVEQFITTITDHEIGHAAQIAKALSLSF